ncbi:hypothetical protein AJ79_01550 [Helicocarpus griseus UAMH5409]|uniref:DUF7137 domain-containing protein n=1 Tax=Helicocarpus griseus UAMH5409 TaxID=1447875 RepID=A0A2B7Y702_9EURO|nr:hypothetical protein AJ79_01550 [Helicocarpus griseus UAMH5409]
MRSSSQLFIFCSLLLLASYVSASFWDNKAGVAQPVAIDRRQDQEDTPKEEPSTTQESQDSTITSDPTKTSDSTETNADKTTDATTGTKAKETGTKAAKTTDKEKPTDIPFDAPVGGIEMVKPAITDGPTYIKIGTEATFKWNYTSLIATPSAVDAVAFCSRNSHTYTITSNMTVEKTAEVKWDTAQYKSQDVPLLTEEYTLMVYDNTKEPSDVPEPGHLGSFNQYRFGMYHPQDYTPRTESTCATCSAAMSDMERQALKVMFGTAMITVLSFTWFVTGIGVFG